MHEKKCATTMAIMLLMLMQAIPAAASLRAQKKVAANNMKAPEVEG